MSGRAGRWVALVRPMLPLGKRLRFPYQRSTGLRDVAMVSAGFYRNYSWAGTSAAMEGADDVDA